MPPPAGGSMAKTVIGARTTGASRLARRLVATSHSLDSDLMDAQREVGRDAVLVFRRHAQKRSGRLHRGIVSRPQGSVVRVTAEARDPESGFDYVAVTRFGHRKAIIRPKHPPKPGRYLAAIPGIGPRWVSKVAALRTPFGFRRSVKGVKVKFDWRDKALPEIERNANIIVTRLGRRIIARIG